MAAERETIDISNNPDLLRLAEDVRRRNASTVLRNGDEAVAVMMPVADSEAQSAARSLQAEIPGRYRCLPRLSRRLERFGGYRAVEAGHR
jgi:hypothetical protein